MSSSHAASFDVRQGRRVLVPHNIRTLSDAWPTDFVKESDVKSGDWKNRILRRTSSLIHLVPLMLVSGCKLELLDPKGSIGMAEKQLIATSTWAMLVVVVPVIALTLLFAWRYRASNTQAEYWPRWAHSTAIEVVIWTIPSLIILFLAVLTWKRPTNWIRTSRSNRR
jgi:hypothetical protein